MEYAIAIGIGGWAFIVIGAVVIGVLAQLVGDAHFGYEWVLTGIGAAVGAVVASELIVTLRTWEPVWDGLAIVPAILGGLIGGAIVALVTRYVTSEPGAHRPVSA